MARFCGKCGSPLDPETGLCPNCDRPQAETKKEKPSKGRYARKPRHGWKIALVVVLAVLLLGSGGAFFVLSGHSDAGADVPEQQEQQMQQEEVLEFPDGSTVFLPAGENLACEDDTLYYNNLLSVYLMEDLDGAGEQALADSVGGEAVGSQRGDIRFLQIRVPESTLQALNEKAELLMESDAVLYASYDQPMLVSPEAADPWSADPNVPEYEMGNEDSPAGGDWWAEAIGAFTAWKYQDLCQSVDVGILDAGFDLEHEDLQGRLSMLPNWTDNYPSDHGTHVAGILTAAWDNGVGLHGILPRANVYCADWNGNPDQWHPTNQLTNGNYVKILNDMLQQDVRVINNSWGREIKSEALWERDDKTGILGAFRTYDAYRRAMENSTRNQGKEILIMVASALRARGENRPDFLLVASAGNGYLDPAPDNKVQQGAGFDAEGASGFAAALNPEVFDALGKLQQTKLEKAGVSYQDVRNHILVVGAVMNQKTNSDQYKMTGFSNYGSGVEICAPGKNVFSTVTVKDDNLNSEKDSIWNGSSYWAMDGTSMAAPMVSGSAAYLWSLDGSLTAREVKYLLCMADPVGALGTDGKPYSMLNLGTSVDMLMGQIGDVVRLGQDVYFWKYCQESFPGTTGYLRGAFPYETDAVNQLVRRSADGGETVLLEDTGSGRLAISGGRIYYNRTVIYGKEQPLLSCDLEGKDLREHGTGTLTAVGRGRVLVDDRHTLTSVDGNLGQRLPLTQGRLLTCRNGTLYYEKPVADSSEARRGRVILAAVDLDGENDVELCVTEPDLYSGGDSDCYIAKAVFTENRIYFSYGAVAGTGLIFQGGRIMSLAYDGTDIRRECDISDAGFTVEVDDGGRETVRTDGPTDWSTYVLEDDLLYLEDGGCTYWMDPLTGSPELLFRGEELVNALGGGDNRSLSWAMKTGDDAYGLYCFSRVLDPNRMRPEYVLIRAVMVHKNLETGEMDVLYDTSQQ